MKKLIETVLDHFAAGELSRREAVAALAAFAAPQASSGAAPLDPRNINHVRLSMRDIATSGAFYQKAADTIAARAGVKFKEGQLYADDPDGARVQFARPDHAREMNI